MAQRRMFSLQIVDSAAFLEMPISSQLLYFHLSMRADDDGFVGNPKKISRIVNANDDDFKVLLAKRFVLSFESGVIVIKHWKIHNYIQSDRYKETLYLEEKKNIITKENNSYTECIQNVSKVDTQVRLELGKVRLGKENTSEPSSRVKSKHNPLGGEILKAFESVDSKNKTYYGNTTQRKACDFLLGEYGLEEVLKRISILPQTNKIPYFPAINTPYDLKEKWVKLQDAVDKKRKESKTLLDKKGVCL